MFWSNKMSLREVVYRIEARDTAPISDDRMPAMGGRHSSGHLLPIGNAVLLLDTPLDVLLPLLSEALVVVGRVIHPHPAGTLLDGIERLKRRCRELEADAHRIRSSPFPSSWAKEQVRTQVAALAQRGAPDVTLLVEHGRTRITWPMQTVRSQVLNTETRAAVAFAEAPDMIAAMTWAIGEEAMVARLDALIDAEADDANALDHSERELREAEVLADLLENQRSEGGACLGRIGTRHAM
jgi:hypothetical protein